MKMRRNNRDIYVMGFSSGDFPTDHYGINLAFGFTPDGPYSPVLTEDGKDLRDFGRSCGNSMDCRGDPLVRLFIAIATANYGWPFMLSKRRTTRARILIAGLQIQTSITGEFSWCRSRFSCIAANPNSTLARLSAGRSA